jgi:hypothetical protein
VYSLNPTMTEMLTKQRVSELSSQIALSRRSGLAEGERAKRERLFRLRSVRKATGWALVELGLRLAVPRRRAVPGAHAVPGANAVRGRSTVPGPVTVRSGAAVAGGRLSRVRQPSGW